MTETALLCERVSKSYGAVHAAREVTLPVRRGEFLALLGPSGCGKTTTLRLLAGFERPDSGRVWVGEQLVAGPGVFVPPERRRIGMVFQDYALFPHMSVARNLAYGIPKGKIQQQLVRQALELVGLAEVAQRMPNELSGGQQQRVALARALASQPEVVLLDEPFSNLDAGLRLRVRGEVREILARAGATAVFVTHDQEEALSLADQVAVMLNGRLVQCASPEEIYLRPASREVALFVGEANLLPGDASGNVATCELGIVPLRTWRQGASEIVIRPEELQIEPDEQGSAVVVERSFFGHDQALSVRLPSAALLRVRVALGYGGEQLVRVGQRVRVAVRCPVMAF